MPGVVSTAKHVHFISLKWAIYESKQSTNESYAKNANSFAKEKKELWWKANSDGCMVAVKKSGKEAR